MSTRRLSLLLSSLICSSMTYAGEGFYVGAGVGFSDASFEYKSDLLSIVPVGVSLLPLTEFSQEEDAFVGEVSGGYQWLFLEQRWAVSFALEAFADLKSTDFEKDLPLKTPDLNTTYTAQAQLANTYGISLKPGVFFTNNFLLYADLGVAYAELQDINTDFNDPTEFPGTSRGSFDDQNLWGLRVGVGIQWLLTKQFSLDLSWNRDIYTKDIEIRRTLLIGEGGAGNLEEEIKINDLGQDIYLFGFNYYFDVY